jgi:hypothetical protein
MLTKVARRLPDIKQIRLRIYLVWPEKNFDSIGTDFLAELAVAEFHFLFSNDRCIYNYNNNDVSCSTCSKSRKKLLVKHSMLNWRRVARFFLDIPKREKIYQIIIHYTK